MSTITKKWSIERIREVIQKLDEKTSLSASELNIVFEDFDSDEFESFSNSENVFGYYKFTKKDTPEEEKRLLCYYNPSKREFGFNKKFFNNRKVKEEAVIDAIRHEYAHYYAEEVNTKAFFNHLSDDDHDVDWAWSCKMLNAKQAKDYNPYSYRNSLLSDKESESYFNADDVQELDVVSFIKKWKHLPLTSEVAKRSVDYIKMTNPNSYYELNDEVLHPKFGFGKVIETAPCSFLTQKMLVEFEDSRKEIFEASELLKIIDGCAYPYRAVSNAIEEEVMLSH